MHRLGRIVCLALLVGCAHRQPAELARTTPWATARDHGRYVTVNGLRVLIAGSELLVLEQTGHVPQEERPERTAAEITRWIEAHP